MHKSIFAALLVAPLVANASAFEETTVSLSGQVSFGAAGRAPELQVGVHTARYAPLLNRQLPLVGLAWGSGQVLAPTLLGAPLVAPAPALRADGEGGVGDTIVKTTAILAGSAVAIVAIGVSGADDIFDGDGSRGDSGGDNETNCGVSGDVIGPRDPEVNTDCSGD